MIWTNFTNFPQSHIIVALSDLHPTPVRPLDRAD